MKLIYFVTIATCIIYTTLAIEDYDSDSADYSLENIKDVRVFAANETEEDRKCVKPGLMCKNCDSLVNCVLEENGKYDQIAIQTCNSNSGETCLRDHCTYDQNPVCVKNYVFDCTSTGVFPDPFNCRKFHYCVGKQTAENDIEIIEGSVGKISLLCDKKHSYDPITSYCKFNLTDGCSYDQYPVPICTKSGQSGALSNKSIYYVCVVTGANKLSPKLYLCPHGKIYSNNQCV